MLPNLFNQLTLCDAKALSFCGYRLSYLREYLRVQLISPWTWLPPWLLSRGAIYEAPSLTHFINLTNFCWPCILGPCR